MGVTGQGALRGAERMIIRRDPSTGDVIAGFRRRVRRGAGVVERVGLENRSTGNCTVGSNPTLSASSHASRAFHPTSRRAEWQVSWAFGG